MWPASIAMSATRTPTAASKSPLPQTTLAPTASPVRRTTTALPAAVWAISHCQMATYAMMAALALPVTSAGAAIAPETPIRKWPDGCAILTTGATSCLLASKVYARPHRAQRANPATTPIHAPRIPVARRCWLARALARTSPPLPPKGVLAKPLRYWHLQQGSLRRWPGFVRDGVDRDL